VIYPLCNSVYKFLFNRHTMFKTSRGDGVCRSHQHAVAAAACRGARHRRDAYLRPYRATRPSCAKAAPRPMTFGPQIYTSSITNNP